MTYSKLNASQATLTRNRTPDSVCPFSGLCATCIEGCPGLCEVGKSAYRGTEVLYPQPFGEITAAAEKDYPVDWSHFTIMGTCVGAVGVEADSEHAIFPNVNLEIAIGRNKDLKLKLPFVIPGLGSTDIAKKYWAELAAGAAISGIILTVGENVCGMDDDGKVENGKVVDSPELRRRVELFKRWYQGYGAIVVQSNVEDTNLGVLEYAIQKLGVEAVELKWGQGAKDIGGEVKIRSLEKAQLLKRRGYIVLPDPEDPENIEAFKIGGIKEFERHSRLGMVDRDSFLKRVEELRSLGAKYVFLKTGAYRPADLARAIKFASLAQIDLLTIDGAGGGTGMSPWRMMNEWGIPTVYIEALAYDYATRLAQKGEYVPDIAIAGGFSLEDQIFKALAMGAPYVKMVGLARASLTAAMVGKTIAQSIEEGKPLSQVSKYGNSLEEVFIFAHHLKRELGDSAFAEFPKGAIGVYSYYARLAQGLRQLMAGERKFDLKYLDRNDILALTKEASEITGITYIMEGDKEEVEKILNS